MIRMIELLDKELREYTWKTSIRGVSGETQMRSWAFKIKKSITAILTMTRSSLAAFQGSDNSVGKKKRRKAREHANA